MGGDAATLDRIKTHYDTLQVARDASPEVITAAYRALSRVHHPDRNVGKDDADTMALLNASYAVLSDPQRRRVHDQWIEAQEEWKVAADDTAGWEDGSWEGTSAGWVREARPRARSPLRRFAPAFALLVFVGAGAVFLATQPEARPSGLPPYDRSGEKAAAVANASAAVKAAGPIAAPAAAAAGVRPLALDLLGTAKEEDARSSAFVKPVAARAPNGAPWPNQAAYVPGYTQGRTDGLSNVLINNRGNESPMFLKLVAIDEQRTMPVRHVFVPPRSSFQIEKVRPGRYDVRYQNLGTGSLARSEPFELSEVERPAGREYSNVTLTLYEAPGSAVDTYRLSEKEF
ncbi:MAG: Chaperone protein DnaJ [uncultured Sphingomonadaceae bacterium]|uniref:Chaperone protein DnaJ n=1 Tax=uncultured Sphingomonadaceae bacterium TaxID=169976 RepID=A0A6J4S175_9SPHN|nr:MAG: Chaperone protein DnaJ [uncultured Sphingomonadaceae bacterium]